MPRQTSDMDLKPSKFKFRLPSRYYDRVCRVCLSDAKVLVPLKDVYLTHCFAAKGKIENISLVDVIYKFCNIVVTSSDGKPQHICESCINMSMQAFSFLQSFLYSENFLNEKLPLNERPVSSIFNSDIQLANTLIKIESQNDDSVSEDIRFEIVDSSNTEDVDNNCNDVNIQEYKECKDDPHDQDRKDVLANEKTKISFLELMEQLDLKSVAVRPTKGDMASPTTHRGNTFTCKMCGFHCLGIQVMIQHANEKHVDRKSTYNKCVLCPNQFRECQYNYHLATHCRNSLVCKYCFLYFETKEAFDEHDKIIDHKNFTCKLCNKKFVETKGKKGKLVAMRMRLHLRYAHQQEGMSECNVCGKKFKYAANVRRHYRSVHGQVKFSCQSCPRAFTSSYQLKCHVDRFHPEDVAADLKAKYPHRFKTDSTSNTTVIQCEFCNARFRTMHAFYVHSEKHVEFTEYGCQICEMEFPTFDELLDHQEEHPQHKCTYCDQKFVLLCDLIAHKVKHRDRKSQTDDSKPKSGVVTLHPKQGPQVIKCEYCPKVVRSFFGLYGHSWIHPEFKDYKCQTCEMLTDSMDSFREHYMENHPEMVCEICQKIFPNRRSYFCHKSTKHRDQLVKVNRSCEICGLSFASTGKRQMEQHMYIHTGERPYMCEICGKGFKQEAHLSIHRFQHGEVQMKPWKCKLCSKSFVFPSTLKCHIRTHTGEKPYTCLFCPKAFRDQTSRHKHIKKYHETRVPEYEVYRKEHLRDEMKRVETDIETTLYECDKALWKKQRFQGMGRSMRKKREETEQNNKDTRSVKTEERRKTTDFSSTKKEDDDISTGENELIDNNEDQEDEFDYECILKELKYYASRKEYSDGENDDDEGNEIIKLINEDESEMAELGDESFEDDDGED